MAPTNADAGQLSGLLKGASLEDHQERLDRADATLRSHPGDLAAAHTKVVALLNLDRFDDAVKAIDAGGPQLQRRCALERAYGLYKAGRLDDAAKAAREGSAATGNSTASAASRKRAFDHVAAQVAYRAERFDVAAAIYPRLVAAGYGAAANDGEENDLKINLLATASQLEWQGRGFVLDRQWKQPARGDLDVFETAYNAGCACLARWDFERAAILLKRARQLCEASDELDDEEKEAEVQSIIIQQICESIYAGRTDDAKELLSKAISKECVQAR